MKSFCHSFIDCFFNHKDELQSIRNEIQKLEWMFINSHITSTNAAYYMRQMPIINNNNNNVRYVVSSENKFSYHSERKKSENKKDNNEFIYENNFTATFGKKKENIDNIINSNKKEMNINLNKTFDLSFSTGNKINEKDNRDYPETIKEQEEEYYISNKKLENKNDNNLFEENSQIDEMENMKNINLKDIKDDEFDSFLSRLKNKKKSLPIQINNNEQNKNIDLKSKKKNSFEPTSNSKNNLIETDFIAGNKKATYKPNEKTKKLLEEMDKEVNFYEDIDDASKTKSKIKNMFPEKISNTKRNYNESMKFIKNQSKKKENNINDSNSKQNLNEKDNIQSVNESSDENEEINMKKKLMKYPAYRINKQISKDKEIKKDNNNNKGKNSKVKKIKDKFEEKKEEVIKKEIVPLKIQNFQ